MDTRQKPYQEPSCPDGAEPGRGSARRANVGQNGSQRTYGSRKMLKGAAERAENSADALIEDVLRETPRRQNHGRDGITAILDEVEVQRRSIQAQQPNAEYSSREQEAPAGTRVRREEDARRPQRPKAPVQRPERRKPVPHTAAQAKALPKERPKQKNAKGKKKRNQYSFTEVLKTFLPWKGDSAFEAFRKIVFSTALVVVGVCTFLISNYYIDRYKAKKEYEDIQARILDARANRHYSNEQMEKDPVTGEMFEWLEYNDYANRLLPINPDMVGYVTVPGTEVSYPVVQKKSLPDPNQNPNDYYLYRTFKQESSKSGCIFMDYRNHFDEVVDHRRVVENSGNVFIYGHNMNNRTMFGSLRDYINNPSFYSAHPIVEYSSLYKDYRFKIFAIFIVDGEDFTSEYAFDAWNTLDFEDEEHFYHYVNEAKKRTLINTDVDVKYGEQLLSLYTCTGLVQNAKLILMCRELRAGEDLYEGTENATLNTNVLYPWAYYKYGRPVNYDPKKFVPYGPEA